MLRFAPLAVAAAAVIVIVVIGSGLLVPPDVGPPPATASPSAPAPSAAARDEVVHGWPDTGRNPAGTYSWDGFSCAGSYCNVGFMHNGYGSGDVEILLDFVPGGTVAEGDGTAVTVAGHDAVYRRIDARRETWTVDIEGTPIGIRLEAQPGTSQADLDEAHAIIGSMRTEAQDNDIGFQLVFTLTTNDWDSG